jgi:hypothetical protein
MEAHLRGAGGKRGRSKLVRRYGFGVPHVDRALRSANDALTLIAQSTIHPFSLGKMREMHFHQLPWPRGVLEELGETAVSLRVTLSYFIEPNPGRRGWRQRYRYASHGLRFELKSPIETVDQSAASDAENRHVMLQRFDQERGDERRFAHLANAMLAERGAREFKINIEKDHSRGL